MPTTTQESLTTEIGHPIKYVAQHTGLSTHVIRVWERRYNAISPVRTPTNRRLYSETDIRRLQLLNHATKAGLNISQIAHLETEKLASLAQKTAHPPFQLTPPVRDLAADDDEVAENTPKAFINRCFASMKDLDAVGLETALGQAAVALSQVKLLDEVIVPLMHQIGNAWQQGELRISDEHLASSVVRTFISKLQTTYNKNASGPSLLVTTPAGQRHEIGALLVASAASASGCRITYLGPDLPAIEITEAAQRKQVQAIALSIVYPADDPHIGDELRELRRAVGDQLPILIGGRSASGYLDSVHAINAIYLDDVSTLKNHLENLRQQPTTT